jgi:hypothetical protein
MPLPLSTSGPVILFSKRRQAQSNCSSSGTSRGGVAMDVILSARGIGRIPICSAR